MALDRSYVARNDASRERLRALVARLTDERLGRPIGHGWTVSAALAHLAHWDRRALAALEEWERTGVRISPADADAVNEARLPEWLATPPRQAARQVLDAAETVDRKAERLAADLVEAILATGRVRALDRSPHRHEHLDEIERALVG